MAAVLDIMGTNVPATAKVLLDGARLDNRMCSNIRTTVW